MPSPSASPIIDRVARSVDTHGSVLIVEDEPMIADVVARYLDRAGLRDRERRTTAPRRSRRR